MVNRTCSRRAAKPVLSAAFVTQETLFILRNAGLFRTSAGESYQVRWLQADSTFATTF